MMHAEWWPPLETGRRIVESSIDFGSRQIFSVVNFAVDDALQPQYGKFSDELIRK
jgi:hypothetical protein